MEQKKTKQNTSFVLQSHIRSMTTVAFADEREF